MEVLGLSLPEMEAKPRWRLAGLHSWADQLLPLFFLHPPSFFWKNGGESWKKNGGK